jgi:hypothetical protein
MFIYWVIYNCSCHYIICYSSFYYWILPMKLCPTGISSMYCPNSKYCNEYYCSKYLLCPTDLLLLIIYMSIRISILSNCSLQSLFFHYSNLNSHSTTSLYIRLIHWSYYMRIYCWIDLLILLIIESLILPSCREQLVLIHTGFIYKVMYKVIYKVVLISIYKVIYKVINYYCIIRLLMNITYEEYFEYT